ncbi:hypothetical protein TB2_039784 [Malus domestica]
MGRDPIKIGNLRSNGKRKPKIGWAETQMGKENPRSDGQRPNQDQKSKIEREKKTQDRMGRDPIKIGNLRSNGKRKPKIGWAETQSRSEI